MTVDVGYEGYALLRSKRRPQCDPIGDDLLEVDRRRRVAGGVDAAEGEQVIGESCQAVEVGECRGDVLVACRPRAGVFESQSHGSKGCSQLVRRV